MSWQIGGLVFMHMQGLKENGLDVWSAASEIVYLLGMGVLFNLLNTNALV